MALGALVLVAACSKPAAPPPQTPQVGVVQVTEQPVTLSTELPGRITAVETSEVRPQISGVIRRRLFAEGSMVKAGQTLYEIEDAPYRAALGTAQGQLGAAQAQINATRLQAQRYNELVRLNAVSKQEADNATGSAAQARANVAAQRSAVEAARVNLNFTRIKAPISGRIGRSLFTAGALVQTGQADPLATIQRTDTVYVDVTQSAAQLLDLKAAMQSGQVTGGGQGARVQLILPNGQPHRHAAPGHVCPRETGAGHAGQGDAGAAARGQPRRAWQPDRDGRRPRQQDRAAHAADDADPGRQLAGHRRRQVGRQDRRRRRHDAASGHGGEGDPVEPQCEAGSRRRSGTG
jgi:multidrug efflux pump subunit AcrA (membrane-fusion protein)